MSSVPPTSGFDPRSLPTFSEVLARTEPVSETATVEERYERHFTRQAVEIEERYTHLKGLESHYAHKAGWSIFLGFAISVMILFQILLLSLVGAGIWSFEKYSWLLPALLVQNLAQVIGLAVIVVKSLFKDLRA